MVYLSLEFADAKMVACTPGIKGAVKGFRLSDPLWEAVATVY